MPFRSVAPCRCWVLVLSLLLGGVALLPGQAAPERIAMEVPDVMVFQEGAIVALPPLVELLDAQVRTAGKTTTVTRQGHTFTFSEGKSTAQANGRQLTLPIAPFARKTVIFLPFRACIEALGGTIHPDSAAQSMQFTLPGLPAPQRWPLVPVLGSQQQAQPISVLQYHDAADQLFIIRPDGTGLRRVTYSVGSRQLPAISADGSKWAYLHSNDFFPWIGDVYSRPASTQQPTCLSHGFNMDVTLTPNGAAIWYTKAAKKQTSIWRVPFAGGTPEIMVPEGAAPCFSADGKRCAYFANDPVTKAHAIHVKDENGDILYTRTLEAWLDGPLLSPDGRTLAFYRNYQADHFKRNIVICQLGNVKVDPPMVEPTQADRAYNETNPAFTPDSAHILFVRNDKQRPGIFIMKTDRTECRQLTKAQDICPVPSPDGAYIYFVRDGLLYRMNADGSAPLALTKTTAETQTIKDVGTVTLFRQLYVKSIHCAPDGSLIFFTAAPETISGL